MGIYDGTEEVGSRTMVLFFVVDVSSSMEGKKIGALNEAINNVIPEIKDISESSADANIKIAVLKFSTGAEWVYPAPIEAEDFKWTYLNPDGWTDFGMACKLLNEKLSRTTGFMTAAGGSFAPVILLLSDGEPTDIYKPSLDELKKNNWFKNAIRIAIAIGDDANTNVLGEFTGSSERVVKVHSPEALKKLIQFVSVASATIASKSKDSKELTLTKEDEVTEQLGEMVTSGELDDPGGGEW
jgi:uncharacterized protein YegL